MGRSKDMNYSCKHIKSVAYAYNLQLSEIVVVSFKRNETGSSHTFEICISNLREN